MRRPIGHLAMVLMVALLAGCSSRSAEEEGGSLAGGGEPRGVTAEVVKVSLIYADLAALTQQKLAPEIGNAKDQAEAVAADINAKGGIAGRRIEIVPHVIEGAAAALSPEAGRAACLAAAEDDKPLAVLVTASVSADVVNCVAVEHHALTLAMDSYPASYYEDSGGRLFSVGSHISVGTDRAYAAWPRLLGPRVDLAARTVGIVSTDQPAEAAPVDGALKPALERMGVKVVAEATLPCPEGSQSCTQHDAAVQKMRDAGVDLVFLTAQLFAGAATVDAAQKLGYKPAWTVIGNNVTDTVAKFYVNAKDDYDGAWGLGAVFPQVSTAGEECNRTVSANGGTAFPPTSDGYGFTAVTCLQVRTLARALTAVEGPVTTDAVVGALENLGQVDLAAGPPGSLAPDKHDAGNALFLTRYDAGGSTFLPVDGGRPLEVP